VTASMPQQMPPATPFFRTGRDLAGLLPVDAGAWTASLFRRWRAADPALTLDAAILRLEEAPAGVSLAAFARAKHRTADGYRRAFQPWYGPPAV
jgi:hypothetical protein